MLGLEGFGAAVKKAVYLQREQVGFFFPLEFPVGR